MKKHIYGAWLRAELLTKLALVYIAAWFLIAGGSWWWLQDRAQALSLCLGLSVVGVSFFSLLWCGQRVLDKRGLAKVAFIMVIKYVVLGALLVWAFSWPGFWAIGFLLGLGALFPLLAVFYFLGR